MKLSFFTAMPMSKLKSIVVREFGFSSLRQAQGPPQTTILIFKNTFIDKLRVTSFIT